MSGVVITKVIHEAHAFEIERLMHSGKTIGNMVDDYLVAAARSGDKVQSVEVELSPEDWSRIADAVPKPLTLDSGPDRKSKLGRRLDD